MELIQNILHEFWGVLGEMSPYLIFGFLIAGILSVFISSRMIEKHLGGRGILPVLKSALFGIPLPLCSCGVIPVSASLRKSGASRGAVTAFLISTPQTGVDSIMVTFSLLGPVYAVFRPIAALITGVIGGGLVDAFAGNGRIPDKTAKKKIAADENGGRLSRLLHYGFITLPRDIAKPLLAGLVIAALMTVFVPDDMFTGFLGGGIIGMIAMMFIGIPVYVCATASVPIAAAMILKGVSPGVALVFLMTGPATNAAAISTIWKVLGKRTAIIYLATVALGSLAGGLLLDAIYTAKGLEPGQTMPWMLPPVIKSASAVLMVSILLYAIIKPWLPAKTNPENLTPGAKLPDLTLNIKGMTCSHCAMNVRRALNENEGVDAVIVDLPAGTAQISGEGYNLTDLKKSVEDIGYSVIDTKTAS